MGLKEEGPRWHLQDREAHPPKVTATRSTRFTRSRTGAPGTGRPVCTRCRWQHRVGQKGPRCPRSSYAAASVSLSLRGLEEGSDRC